MAKKPHRGAFNLAAGLGLASLHAGITLWYRLPMLAARGGSDPEIARMVSEKTAAMFEGALDAQVEAMRLAGAAVTGKLQLGDIVGAPAAIAEAGLRPAFRRVRANSRRLRRQGRSGG
jgi:hypothetical protein